MRQCGTPTIAQITRASILKNGALAFRRSILSGRPPTFAEDFVNIAMGVILMPLVIPWGYVYRHYLRQRADCWRESSS